MIVHFEEGRIVRLIGDKDNPVYHGYSCVKGRNFHEFHYSQERVTQPLKRTSEGGHKAIPASQAFDEIAARLTGIVEQHGSRAVAMYTGTFSHFCVGGVMTRHAFMEALGSPMHFTNATIDQPGKPIAMALHGRWGAGPQAFADSNVCMLVGANPLVSMWGGIPPFNPAKRLHDAKKRGLKLIVIDPRKTECARKADIHLQCLPGHDPEILAAMIRVIIAEELYDKDFVAAETEGFKSLSEAVRPFTPELAAARAGLDADDIRAAARMFANARKGNATGGTGSNMAPHGTLMEYLLLSLNTLCGRWVRAGETVPNLGVFFRMFSGVARAEKPRPGFGFGEALRVRGLTNTAAGMPTAALADEILEPGDGQVRALIVVGGNPLTAFPNRAKVKKALESLDLLVVIDPQLSATARLAHYVIGPKFGYELPAISFANEGMVTYGLSIGFQEPYAQYQPALINPPEGAEVVEDWRVFFEIGRRMELQLAYRGYTYDMQNAPTTDALIEEFVRRSPVSIDEVRKYPEGHIFEHQSAPAEPREPDWPHRLQLGNADMLAELVLLAGSAETGVAGMAPNELPLLLVSRREHEVYNSVGHRLEALAARRPYNPVHMNPEDAAQLGVVDGGRVDISTRTATVRGTVKLADDVRRGVVSVCHGFPNDAGADGSGGARGTSTSALIDDVTDYDAFSGMPRMSAVPVVLRSAI
jgi:anaerobic selenocysteine-containing dehydrogenase